ncbi:hypothetical protein ITX31_13650 [Arthrobacter gandavensis]|uniref:hypothetical protein n=1 Tax=Arthrobacter gandavensis TaxID=169960 RepID=UPI00188E8162|nr:hypothetical protein [Arthrobacter gandavensis]MBF4995149.1 hypothetical protein [Arthrobacter gandavensis]
MPVRKHTHRRAAALCLTAALLPAAAACGPTAEQMTDRIQSAASKPPPAEPVPQHAGPRSAEPEPTVVPEPVQVSVSGAQAGMAESVQEACLFLLRGDSGEFTGAGDCVAAAMEAGAGAEQQVTTTASWLPPGTYTMQFSTAPEFAMELRSADDELQISVSESGRTLRTGESVATADSSGGAEEAYAAVLADAAELTANPDRLRSLVQTAATVRAEYGVEYHGTAATRLTAVVNAERPGDFSGSLVLTLDELYRPLLIDYSGATRGISTSIRAEITGWGSGAGQR